MFSSWEVSDILRRVLAVLVVVAVEDMALLVAADSKEEAAHKLQKEATP